MGQHARKRRPLRRRLKQVAYTTGKIQPLNDASHTTDYLEHNVSMPVIITIDCCVCASLSLENSSRAIGSGIFSTARWVVSLAYYLRYPRLDFMLCLIRAGVQCVAAESGPY